MKLFSSRISAKMRRRLLLLPGLLVIAVVTVIICVSDCDATEDMQQLQQQQYNSVLPTVSSSYPYYQNQAQTDPVIFLITTLIGRIKLRLVLIKMNIMWFNWSRPYLPIRIMSQCVNYPLCPSQPWDDWIGNANSNCKYNFRKF